MNVLEHAHPCPSICGDICNPDFLSGLYGLTGHRHMLCECHLG
ncbi:hypothetical protein JN12_01243 [Geobacter argillaceus]|uniref:Uncharacterized protein n=1 Tax=Geobacter argillaceus TaxID=345631 RepID=A0A562W949_9BACT|nr:hypothetical protein JN12_01243 [Geobacter argillaceus]